MNKVMTRTQRRPGTRPPGRQDTRRPGATPPRAPGDGASRTTPGGSPQPSSPRVGAPGPAASGTAATGTVKARTVTAGTVRGRTTGATGAVGATADRSAAAVAARQAPPLASPDTSSGPHGGLRAPAPQPRPTDLFADRLLAVLSGRRPVHCMLRHTAGRAYDELAWLAERGRLRTRGARPVVRDIGYYVPRPGAIEAFARIGAGDQVRAMAFRLEQGPDLRWRCTAVELGGPRMPRSGDDD